MNISKSAENSCGRLLEAAHYELTFRIFQKAAKTELMCEIMRILKNCLLSCSTMLKPISIKRSAWLNKRHLFHPSAILSRQSKPPIKGLPISAKPFEFPYGCGLKRKELMAQIASKNVDVWETILNMPLHQRQEVQDRA